MSDNVGDGRESKRDENRGGRLSDREAARPRMPITHVIIIIKKVCPRNSQNAPNARRRREAHPSAATPAYDRLVFALGGRIVRPAIPGLEAHAFDVDTFEAGRRLNERRLPKPTRPYRTGVAA